MIGLRLFLSISAVLLGLGLLSLGQVVINEVGWAGTAASGYDEWIELYNSSPVEVDLTGWRLILGERELPLSGSIPPWGFFLLERTDDTTVSDVQADLIYKGALPNTGTVLQLVDPAGVVVDTANAGAKEGWFAGDVETAASMERISPELPDSPVSWRTGTKGNAHDVEGKEVYGTPGAENAARSRLLPLECSIPGSPLSGTVELSWEVMSDVEGIEVKIFVKTGTFWELVAEGLPPTGTYTLDTAGFPNGKILIALGAFDAGGPRGGVVVEGEVAN